MSQSVGSSVSTVVAGVRAIAPPPSIGSKLAGVAGYGALSVVGVIGAASSIVDLVGVAGGNKFRDDLLDKIRRRSNEPAAGFRELLSPPPFNGGQSVGVSYYVLVRVTYSNTTSTAISAGINVWSEGTSFADLIIGGQRLTYRGPISGVKLVQISDSQWKYIVSGVTSSAIFNSLGGIFPVSASILEIRRVDLQPDTGGDPPGSSLGTSPAGYTGNTGIGSADSLRGATASPQTTPAPTANPAPSGAPRPNDNREPARSPFGLPNGFSFGPIGAAVGIGSPNGLTGTPPQTQPPATKPNIAPDTTRPPQPNQDPPPPTPKPKEDDRRAPVPPPNNPPPTQPPQNPELQNLINRRFDDLGSSIAQVGSISALIAAQTTPEAQRLNSKNGACDALQSPPCTKGMEDRIKDPINDRFDANDVATASILGNQATQNTVLAGITAKIAEVFEFLNRVWANEAVNKVMSALTLFTVIHNAAMLSRDIGETLGSAIDQGLQALGLQLKDKEGNQIGVTGIIGNSVRDFVKSVIGTANYTALTETWAKANRIYQTGINLLSNVQSILDSTTAVAELTSNRLAGLMNAVREAGVVREDAYRAQTPNVTRFNAFMNKLENLEQGTSNLAAITSNVVEVQQSVNELKSNREEFDRQINDKDEVQEEAKTDKKEESVFTIANFSIVRPPEENN